MFRLSIIAILCLSNSACYYMQAASGQWQVLQKREPIDAVIADPETPPALAGRLQLLVEARDFSVDQLGLPDNKSYRSFAQIERDYVVWNVIAAPEFSLLPRQWCFPIAGCVAYRGYFAERDAEKAAERLSRKGFDVAVGGVVAYSTLGNFDDPILSSMLQWRDHDLVALLFHELAHQVVYVKDDTAFNESFATAVEQLGLQRWLAETGDAGAYAQYLDRRRHRDAISQAIVEARTDLAAIYQLDLDVSEMRAQKQQRLQQLAGEIRSITDAAGVSLSGWMSGDLNNAHLVSTALYEGLVPQFQALFRDCGSEFECFYAAAARLADLDREARDRVLATGDLRRFASGADEE